MINHIWSVLCTKSIIDIESNTVSLLEVIEEVTVSAPVAVGDKTVLPFSYEICSLWSRGEDDVMGKGQARISLLAPSGELIKSIDYAVDLSKHARARTRARIQGLPLKGEGGYTFVVQLRAESGEWLELTHIPLRLKFQSGGQTPPPSGPSTHTINLN